MLPRKAKMVLNWTDLPVVKCKGPWSVLTGQENPKSDVITSVLYMFMNIWNPSQQDDIGVKGCMREWDGLCQSPVSSFVYDVPRQLTALTVTMRVAIDVPT